MAAEKQSLLCCVGAFKRCLFAGYLSVPMAFWAEQHKQYSGQENYPHLYFGIIYFYHNQMSGFYNFSTLYLFIKLAQARYYSR